MDKITQCSGLSKLARQWKGEVSRNTSKNTAKRVVSTEIWNTLFNYLGSFRRSFVQTSVPSWRPSPTPPHPPNPGSINNTNQIRVHLCRFSYSNCISMKLCNDKSNRSDFLCNICAVINPKSIIKLLQMRMQKMNKSIHLIILTVMSNPFIREFEVLQATFIHVRLWTPSIQLDILSMDIAAYPKLCGVHRVPGVQIICMHKRTLQAFRAPVAQNTISHRTWDNHISSISPFSKSELLNPAPSISEVETHDLTILIRNQLTLKCTTPTPIALNASPDVTTP